MNAHGPSHGDQHAADHGPHRRARVQEDEKALYEKIIGRLRQAADGLVPREIAERTGRHPETIRRYLMRGRVGVHFLATFCREYGVNVEWILWGIGPIRRKPSARTPEPPMVVTAEFEVTQGKVVVREVACKPGTIRQAPGKT
ncbi:MAG: helix-turn-helix domain-containing protein [Phycisphaerales bacterium]